MFNTEFDPVIDEKYRGLSFYPEKLRKEIDELNGWWVWLGYCTGSVGCYTSERESEGEEC